MTDTEAKITVIDSATLLPNAAGTIYRLLLEHHAAGYTGASEFYLPMHMPEHWLIVERTDFSVTGRGIGHEYRADDPFTSLAEAQAVFNRRAGREG